MEAIRAFLEDNALSAEAKIGIKNALTTLKPYADFADGKDHPFFKRMPRGGVFGRIAHGLRRIFPGTKPRVAFLRAARPIPKIGWLPESSRTAMVEIGLQSCLRRTIQTALMTSPDGSALGEAFGPSRLADLQAVIADNLGAALAKRYYERFRELFGDSLWEGLKFEHFGLGYERGVSAIAERLLLAATLGRDDIALGYHGLLVPGIVVVGEKNYAPATWVAVVG